MNTKTRVFAMAMAWVLVFAGFALEPVSEEITIGSTLHRVSRKGAESDPKTLIVTDVASSPAEGVANFSITAVLTPEKNLKSLNLIFLVDKVFSASGEIEWQFPSGAKLTMFGKVSTKNNAKGFIEYTITFFSGLVDFRNGASAVGDGNGVVRLHGRGKSAVMEILVPAAFFKLL